MKLDDYDLKILNLIDSVNTLEKENDLLLIKEYLTNHENLRIQSLQRKIEDVYLQISNLIKTIIPDEFNMQEYTIEKVADLDSMDKKAVVWRKKGNPKFTFVIGDIKGDGLAMFCGFISGLMKSYTKKSYKVFLEPYKKLLNQSKVVNDYFFIEHNSLNKSCYKKPGIDPGHAFIQALFDSEGHYNHYKIKSLLPGVVDTSDNYSLYYKAGYKLLSKHFTKIWRPYNILWEEIFRMTDSNDFYLLKANKKIWPSMIDSLARKREKSDDTFNSITEELEKLVSFVSYVLTLKEKGWKHYLIEEKNQPGIKCSKEYFVNHPLKALVSFIIDQYYMGNPINIDNTSIFQVEKIKIPTEVKQYNFSD